MKDYKKACEEYQSHPKGEKQKKRQYGPRRYINLLKIESKDLLSHSHKKRRDSLEGNLDPIIFAAEFQLEFSKMLVPRLPQHTSNVHIEYGRTPKHFYSFCDQLLGALIYLNFIFLTLIYS